MRTVPGTFRHGRSHIGTSLPAALLCAALLWPAAGSADGVARAATARPEGAAAHIAVVMRDPKVIAAIARWGLTRADVQHDIDAMSPGERLRLAQLLARRWRVNETHDRADLQAQFLVTVSLMRESTLFASILSRNPSRLR